MAGGFHTKGITERLRARNISFVVITPNVNKLDQDELYAQRMQEQFAGSEDALLHTRKFAIQSRLAMQDIAPMAREHFYTALFRLAVTYAPRMPTRFCVMSIQNCVVSYRIRSRSAEANSAFLNRSL